MIQNEQKMNKNNSIRLKHLFYQAKKTLDIIVQQKEHIIAKQKFTQRQQRNSQNSEDQISGDEILVDYAKQRNVILLSGNFDKENIINAYNLLEFVAEQLQSSQLLLKEMNELYQILDKINEIKQESEQIESKPIYLAKEQKVEPLQFFQNQNKLQKQNQIQQSFQKYQFQMDCQDLFQKLEKYNKLVNPLKLVINQKIEATNPELLFYVLNDQMKQSNRIFNKSLVPDEKLLYSFHGQFAADSNDSQEYTLTISETPNLTYKLITSDENVRKEFLNKFKTSLSIDLKLPESQIQIVAIEEGSIRVVFEILDAAGVINENENLRELQKQFPGTSPQLKLKSYFKQAALSVDDFDPKYNMTWEYDEFGDYQNRGPMDNPQPYFFPVGWQGYALKVEGRYDNGNNDWLMMDGNENEWYAMFHGTNFWGVQGIMKDGRKIKSRTDGVDAYSGSTCLITNKIIGKGVYFSNHIEVCEKYYAVPTKIGKKEFLAVFQSRVRPSALRQCQKPSDIDDLIFKYKRKNRNYNQSLDNMDLWNNDYFVINNTYDIRPYRILLKEITKVERK